MHAVNVYADIEESSSNCRIGIWKQGLYIHKYLNLQERASVAFSRIGRNMQRASVFNHYFIVQSEMEDHFDKKARGSCITTIRTGPTNLDHPYSIRVAHWSAEIPLSITL